MAIKEIYQMVFDFKQEEIKDLVQAEIDAGTEISSILNEGLLAAMDEVGKLFSEGTLFIPEMLVAAQTMKAGLEVLGPHLGESGAAYKGKIVIGTVKGDLHDIGKNLVGMMLEGSGFKVFDLGTDVPEEDFLKSAKENNADIVALSALLTTTMPAMERATKMIKEELPNTKVITGGAPVTQAYADQIGADGYGADAPGAVTLATNLLS